MQAPKPIPVIRPLRFQEIPVSTGDRRGADELSMTLDSSPANAEPQQAIEPALLLVPQTTDTPR